MHDYPLAHYPHSRTRVRSSALCDVVVARMLGRASNTTTSDAIDTYPSKSPTTFAINDSFDSSSSFFREESGEFISISLVPLFFQLQKLAYSSLFLIINPFFFSIPPFRSLFIRFSAVSIFSTPSWQRIRPSNWNNWNRLTCALENRK